MISNIIGISFCSCVFLLNWKKQSIIIIKRIKHCTNEVKKKKKKKILGISWPRNTVFR